MRKMRPICHGLKLFSMRIEKNIDILNIEEYYNNGSLNWKLCMQERWKTSEVALVTVLID